jgi:hypothetical protein
MRVTITGKMSPALSARLDALPRVCAAAAKAVILEPVLTGAQARMLAREPDAANGIPIYDPEPMGREFDAPARRHSPGQTYSGGPRGLEFLRSVVATLAHAYPQARIDIPGRTGAGPRSLKDALAVPAVYAGGADEGWVGGGFASLRRLEDATQYRAKVILRPHRVLDQERGSASVDSTKLPMRQPSRNPMQLLWWDWDHPGAPDGVNGGWRTASMIAKADGTCEFFPGSEGVEPMIEGWRGVLPARGIHGYWADMEFGSRGRQVTGDWIPEPGENLVRIYLDHGWAKVAFDNPHGQGGALSPRRFLFKAAVDVAEQLKQPKLRVDFATAVVKALREIGGSATVA